VACGMTDMATYSAGALDQNQYLSLTAANVIYNGDDGTCTANAIMKLGLSNSAVDMPSETPATTFAEPRSNTNTVSFDAVQVSGLRRVTATIVISFSYHHGDLTSNWIYQYVGQDTGRKYRITLHYGSYSEVVTSGDLIVKDWTSVITVNASKDVSVSGSASVYFEVTLYDAYADPLNMVSEEDIYFAGGTAYGEPSVLIDSGDVTMFAVGD